ncbi:MAG: hypothetical protein JWQ60_175, partial [Pseudonocardia sp.]|nr:hypothetical protein [Pseudonocardia sp.]
MIRPAAGPRPADTTTTSLVVVRALNLAEQLLTRRYGATVTLADPEDLGGGSARSVVLRARVAENPFGLPRSLVIKHYQRDPTPGRADRFRHEAASCQLFTALSGDRPSPELVAHDPANRLLVLEDLGRSSTLADKLFGSDAAAAERCLLTWARALGRLHAVTAGREHDFDALL